MTSNTNRADSSRDGEVIRPYHRPHLLVYGALRDLTAGGTGMKAEAWKGIAKKKHP